MRAGLIAGSVAAIVAVLVSLPLRSPSDSFLNSATVAIGVLTVGLAAGIVWSKLADQRRAPRYYAGALAAGLGAVLILAAVAETRLDRAVSFTMPLAAIAFLLGGGLVPVVERISTPGSWWLASAAGLMALGVGFGLAGQGDQAGGRLALPSSTESAVVTTAASPSPAAQTAEDGQGEIMTYVVGAGSEATFTVGEQLTRLPLPNDAVVRTTSLSGEVRLDGGPSVIQIDLHTLSSDQRFRDRYIRSTMFPSSPIATFTVDEMGPIEDGFFAGETLELQVSGLLSIRGVEVPLDFELEARNDGDVLFVLGRTTFTWDELHISTPTARSVVSIDDEVRVEVLVRAAQQAAVGD